MLAPGATEGADQDPKELVPGAEPEPPSGGPTQDGELLAKQGFWATRSARLHNAVRNRLTRRRRYSSIIRNCYLPGIHQCPA